MARFTERQPTPREARRAIVVVLEQQTIQDSETATGLDLVERIFISDLQGSKKIVAQAIDWTGRVLHTREFSSIEAARAAYID